MSVHVLIHTFNNNKIKRKIYKYGNTTVFTVVLPFTNVTLRQ